MNLKIESLLATATERVGRQLHGNGGKRDSEEFLARVRPKILSKNLPKKELLDYE